MRRMMEDIKEELGYVIELMKSLRREFIRIQDNAAIPKDSCHY